jgi:hypothetical protein
VVRGAQHTHRERGRGSLTENVLDGTVIGRTMQRHRHLEVIRFLNAVEREGPAGKVVHAVLDNGAHKHPEMRKWLVIRAGRSIYADLGFVAQRR